MYTILYIYIYIYNDIYNYNYVYIYIQYIYYTATCVSFGLHMAILPRSAPASWSVMNWCLPWWSASCPWAQKMRQGRCPPGWWTNPWGAGTSPVKIGKIWENPWIISPKTWRCWENHRTKWFFYFPASHVWLPEGIPLDPLSNFLDMRSNWVEFAQGHWPMQLTGQMLCCKMWLK